MLESLRSHLENDFFLQGEGMELRSCMDLRLHSRSHTLPCESDWPPRSSLLCVHAQVNDNCCEPEQFMVTPNCTIATGTNPGAGAGEDLGGGAGNVPRVDARCLEALGQLGLQLNTGVVSLTPRHLHVCGEANAL